MFSVISEARFLGDFLADIARSFARGCLGCLVLIAGAIVLYFSWPVLAIAAGLGLLWLARRLLGKILGWLLLAILAGAMLAVLGWALAGCSLSTLLILWIMFQPPQVIVVKVDSYGNKI